MALTKAKKEKLQLLLNQLETLEGVPLVMSEPKESDLLAKELIEKEMAVVTAKVKDSVALQTIQKIRDDISKFKESFNLQPLQESVKGLEKQITDSKKSLVADFEKKIKAIPITPDLTNEVEELRKDFERKLQILSDNTFEQDLESIRTQLQVIVSANIDSSKELRAEIVKSTDESLQVRFEELQKEIQKVQTDLNTRISNRGGSQPLQVNVNSSVMSTKYADVNFLQGGNIGWSVADDDTLKRTNIQASILVSPGGGTGITRTTSVLSVSSTLAAAAAVDYAFFPNVGVNLTLPTAVGNTNRYTIKSMVASSILVSAAAGQDIDGSTTALLSAEYESIDLQSNGSVWGII